MWTARVCLYLLTKEGHARRMGGIVQQRELVEIYLIRSKRYKGFTFTSILRIIFNIYYTFSYLQYSLLKINAFDIQYQHLMIYINFASF